VLASDQGFEAGEGFGDLLAGVCERGGGAVSEDEGAEEHGAVEEEELFLDRHECSSLRRRAAAAGRPAVHTRVRGSIGWEGWKVQAGEGSGGAEGGCAAEEVVDLGEELGAVEGFLEEGLFGGGSGAAGEDVCGVSGHEEDLGGGIGGGEVAVELDAVASGHDDVGEE
jgi:hypothetical protein